MLYESDASMDYEVIKRLMQKFSGRYSPNYEQQWILRYLALMLRPGDRIVELGVCNGRTAALLAYTTKATRAVYYGIDNWKMEGSLQALQQLFKANDLMGIFYEETTQNIGQKWGDQYPIHLLFIDAGHDELNVRDDCAIWIPKVAPGGHVVMHDYDDPYDPKSAHWAVRHYGDLATGGWDRRIERGMLVARRPE